MDFVYGHIGRERDIHELFAATFTASEGDDEGKAIGKLVDNMMAITQDKDLFVFSAYENGVLVGCIFFSRLTYPLENRRVFILSPVAVKTSLQKTGVGQKLITHGLDALRQKGIDIVVTYGDPNYYSRVGFQQITEAIAQAPLSLSQPIGWLAQPLIGNDIDPLTGTPICVEALNKPELW